MDEGYPGFLHTIFANSCESVTIFKFLNSNKTKKQIQTAYQLVKGHKISSQQFLNLVNCFYLYQKHWLWHFPSQNYLINKANDVEKRGESSLQM